MFIYLFSKGFIAESNSQLGRFLNPMQAGLKPVLSANSGFNAVQNKKPAASANFPPLNNINPVFNVNNIQKLNINVHIYDSANGMPSLHLNTKPLSSRQPATGKPGIQEVLKYNSKVFVALLSFESNRINS